MNFSVDMGALALPRLSPSIPASMFVPGHAALATPMAIALLETGQITDAMLKPRKNAPLVDVFAANDELKLAERALTQWWTGVKAQFPSKLFTWVLHVQELEAAHGYPLKSSDATAWFCITRSEPPHDSRPPGFAIGRGIQELEQTHPGLGQTVLAVLQDAIFRLPETLTIWHAADWAEWMHWGESENDTEMLEQHLVNSDYETVQEVIDSGEVMTRAMFFETMPDWAMRPQRTVSRNELEGCTAQAAIKACDALSTFACRPGVQIETYDFGTSNNCEHDSTDGALVLLWRINDNAGQVIDEAINQVWNSGEGCEWIDARPVPLTPEGLLNYQRKTEHMMELAQLTENLLLAIGDPI